jgi:hypothetical protein
MKPLTIGQVARCAGVGVKRRPRLGGKDFSSPTSGKRLEPQQPLPDGRVPS